MDLPTYTNIWRIEKRLYKLYDLRLPMPLPIVWIGVFVGVFVPWSLLLWLVGVPVEMPWHVLYLVPPGIVTWLSTRPVIEGKRLTELLESQLRYLGQPRAWYRLSPGAEPETITFSGRVWRVSPARVRVKSSRKARQAQRKRSTQRITGPRQVRPAVAAAAAAAAQAPLVESASPRRGSRPGNAPALGTTALALPPSRQEPGHDADPVRETPAERTGTAETAAPRAATGSKAERRRAQETPVRAAQGSRDTQGSRDVVKDGRDTQAALRLVRDTPAGHEGAVPNDRDESAERAGRQATAGRPIDTEALRRLRKLAASADAPSPTAPAAEEERGRDDEVARNQHRKGQPPRLVATLPLPDSPRAWSPLSPDAKPVKLSRPLRGKEADPEPARHDDAVSPAPSQHDDPTSPQRDHEDAPQDPARSQRDHGDPQQHLLREEDLPQEARRPREGVDAPEGPQGGEKGLVEAPGGGEARSTPPGGGEAESAPQRPSEGLPSAGPDRPGDLPSAGPDRAGDEESRAGSGPSVEERPQAGQRLRPVEWPDDQDDEPLEPEQERQYAEHLQWLADLRPTEQDSDEQLWPDERERPVAGLRAVDDDGPAAEQPVERLRAVGGEKTGGRPQPPERRDAGTVPGPRTGEREPRVRRVESVVGRDSGGWRRIAQVVVGGSGVRTDGSEIDEARARGVFGGSRRIVVLGCTGGAGQSTTALMLGHTLAGYRDDRVVAVDAATGGGSLSSRIEQETPETLTSLLAGLHGVSGYLSMRGFTTRTASGLEVVGADSDAGAEQRLTDRNLFSDHRLGEALSLLDRHYKLTVIDPAASLAAHVLPYADQLVLVLPASEEASEAVAMTYEWLDGHGCADLRRRAVMVVNGVSRRSMADVEQAEAVARGRCRAIVRIPWEDGLAPGGAHVVDPGQLRAAGRRAYLALAGVVVAGFAAQQIRPSEEELASDPPGTRIGER